MITLKIPCFNLDNTFNNGQCFRWNKAQDNWYEGVAYNKVLRIKQQNDTFYFENTTLAELDSLWFDYFDLKRDYAALQCELMLDDHMRTAINYCCGMHILRQEPWETLISFIISQNNHLKRIKGIIEKICAKWGSPLEKDGQIHYSFPTPQQLKAATIKELQECGAGYRASYLYKAAQAAADKNMDFCSFKSLEYGKAKENLMSFSGIGPKVADCILLFGLGFYHAFPVDTWIKKVMQNLYLDKNASNEHIIRYAEGYFGQFAGIAQQYLFFAAREKQIAL